MRYIWNHRYNNKAFSGSNFGPFAWGYESFLGGAMLVLSKLGTGGLIVIVVVGAR